MPRLPPSLLAHARSIHPLLPFLLRPCRDIPSARNELRWLRERVTSSSSPLTTPSLPSLVRQRARGRPLQYVLGDTPFGELEILCREGVLIPRPETETYTFQTADLLRTAIKQQQPRIRSVRVLEPCTGTACISLLLHSLLAPLDIPLDIHALDVSPRALKLARKNLAHNISRHLLSPRAKHDIKIHDLDVFLLPDLARSPPVDATQWLRPTDPDGAELTVLISNPPYISPRAYTDGTTARSVRLYEPKRALVPLASSVSVSDAKSTPDAIKQADAFYGPLLEVAGLVRAQLVVLECGDPGQARRVARLARARGVARLARARGVVVEVWRCDGGGLGSGMEWCRRVGEGEDGDGDGDGGARAVVVKRPPFC